MTTMEIMCDHACLPACLPPMLKQFMMDLVRLELARLCVVTYITEREWNGLARHVFNISIGLEAIAIEKAMPSE